MADLARSQPIAETSFPLSRWRARAALLAIVVVAYCNSFGLGLAQDSRAIVAQDARLQSVSTANIQLILEKNYWWPKAGDGLYRPVTTLSLLFNYAVLGNGPNAAGYHIVNVLLHVLNVWLVYELALLLFRRAGPAFFAAALWAVHPIATEAVTNIVGRADLLAAMAVLGGLLLYVRRQGLGVTALLFVIATVGVFAKENAAVLVGMMLLWDLCFREGKSTVVSRWRDYAAVAASLVVLFLVRHAVLGALPPVEPGYVDNPLRGADFLTARWTALKVIGLDLWLLLVPVALSCDRSFDQIALSTFSDPWAWISLLAVGGILAAAVLRFRKDRLLFWTAGFFAIALLPTSNLAVIIGATVAERFLYLPSVAFAMAVAAVLFRLQGKHATAIVVTLLMLYTVRTVWRNSDWNDSLSLATADIPTSPRSFRLHDMLAKELFDRDARVNIDRIIQEQETSWRILAPLPPPRSSSFPPTLLGLYYTTKADLVEPAQQLEWYRKSRDVLLRAREISQVQEKTYDDLQRTHGAVTVRASNPQLFFILANDYLHLGDNASAVDALRYAKGLNPHTLESYDGLVLAYSAMGNFPLAVTNMEERALVDGFQPSTIAAIRDLYGKIPDGACAFLQDGKAQLNLAGCPRVRGDLCNAFADLAQSYRDALLPADAQQAQSAATRTYGCPQ